MRNVLLNADDMLTCPHCGGHQFDNRRTARAKLTLGVTVGFGALAAPKRLQCLSCREYLKSPAVRQAAPPVSSVAAPLQDYVGPPQPGDVVVTGYTGTDDLRAALDGVAPPKFGSNRDGQVARIAAGEPVLLDHLAEPFASRTAAALREVGFTVETG